jgi:putative serine protease PepD
VVHQLDGTGGTTITRTINGNGFVDRSSLAAIIDKVQPSVVSIDTGSAEGSGVIVSADGYILTNNHVAATAGGKNVTVTFDTGKSAPATIVGTDPKTDLAVLKAQGASGLKAATFGDSSVLQKGDTVLALGSPLGLDGSVTQGIVSALDRTIDEGSQDQNPFGNQPQAGVTIAGAIQTDAAINPGNSGGALVNLAGEVVGINTAIATSGSGQGHIGVGFAIPSNRAKQVADSLIGGKKVSHPVIGVTAGTAEGNAGARIATVSTGGPAEKAGLQKDDVITKVDQKVIHTQEDLINVIQSGQVGDQLKVTFTRGGAEKTTTVTLGESS